MSGFIRSIAAPTAAELEEAAAPGTSPARFRELLEKGEAVALKIAQNPAAPPELLRELAISGQERPPPDGYIVFSNPPPPGGPQYVLSWCPQDDFDWVYSEEVRAAVTRNPNTPPDILFGLGTRFPDDLLANPALPLLVLEGPHLQQLAPHLIELLGQHDSLFRLLLDVAVGHPESRVRRSLAADPRTPPEHLAALARDEEIWVAEAVAHNPNASPDTLMYLMGRPDAENREQLGCNIGRNPKAPPAVLEALVGWNEASVSAALSEREDLPAVLLEGALLVMASGEKEFRRRAAEHPGAPPSVLEKLAEDRSVPIRRKVAERTDAPPGALLTLAGDKQEPIRKLVAGHPNAPPEALALLAKDPVPRIRRAVAANPAVSRELLELLRQDPDPSVRRIALKAG
jgi:hypothetical protein